MGVGQRRLQYRGSGGKPRLHESDLLCPHLLPILPSFFWCYHLPPPEILIFFLILHSQCQPFPLLSLISFSSHLPFLFSPAPPHLSSTSFTGSIKPGPSTPLSLTSPKLKECTIHKSVGCFYIKSHFCAGSRYPEARLLG